MPTVNKEKIIGVRTPALRVFAKKYGKTDEAKEYLQILPHQYYEENNLHGLLIEQIKDYDTCLEELERFLPYIDNWATCDMLAVKVMKKHLDTFIDKVYRWMESDHAYTIRFGISMLMRYYLEDTFQMEYPDKVAQIRSEEYYVNMMRAWILLQHWQNSMRRFFHSWKSREWISGLITRRSRNPLKATGSHKNRRIISGHCG
mgnify:CR=1 FL=1